MSEYEDGGLDCCRGIVTAILLSLPLWAIILGAGCGAWRSWHTGRLADATVILGVVGLILMGLGAWLYRRRLGAQDYEGSSPAIKILKLPNTHEELLVRISGGLGQPKLASSPTSSLTAQTRLYPAYEADPPVAAFERPASQNGAYRYGRASTRLFAVIRIPGGS